MGVAVRQTHPYPPRDALPGRDEVVAIRHANAVDMELDVGEAVCISRVHESEGEDVCLARATERREGLPFDARLGHSDPWGSEGILNEWDNENESHDHDDGDDGESDEPNVFGPQATYAVSVLPHDGGN